MGSYFKPLRRKIGVVTLVLACVLMAGWLRSKNTVDRIHIDNLFHQSAEGEVLFLHSKNGQIRLLIQIEPGYHQKAGHPHRIYQESVLVVPYYCLVMPLTLLSAWLLLSRPRAPKQVTAETTAVGT